MMLLRDKILANTIISPKGCIEWQGYISKSNQYGLMYWYSDKPGSIKTQQYVHRLMWEATNGEIPEGYLVCHTCDNRICVNIEHLFLGTDLMNIHDASRKNRLGRGHKLSNSIRNKIKEEILTGKPQRQIAKEYNTTQSTVSEINRGAHLHSGRKQDCN